MNIYQLVYLKVLAEKGSYKEAAYTCNISQPALSMAIIKFEEELGKPLINRLHHPVKLTAFGQKIYDQCKIVLYEVEVLKSIATDGDDHISGSMRLGIIPTLAPYLLPLFLESFIQEHPKVELEIEETTTNYLIQKLNKGELDAALLVSPLETPSLKFITLFYEEFFVYVNNNSPAKTYIFPEDIDPTELWLLEEGHCLRNQILNLCELQKSGFQNIHYNAGSIETLINLVDEYGGITIIPELATRKMSKPKKNKLISFHPPAPVREVSLAFHRYTVQKTFIQALSQSIIKNIPTYMKREDNFQRVEIEYPKVH